jgi:hypothetical protein
MTAMRKVFATLALLLALPFVAFGQAGAGASPGSGSNSGGGVVGGTFGGSPSSGYTFTSTPITTAPFSGNLLVGANMEQLGTGVYTAGAGWTLAATPTIVEAMEYQVAGSASSYSAAFTYSVNSGNWGGAIAAFSCPSPVLVQGSSASAANTLAFGSNNSAGHLLVAAIRYNSGADGGPITSVTDTRGNTWVLAGRRVPEGYAKGVSDTNFLEIWYTPNSAAGTNTITPNNLTGPAGIYMSVAEFSGCATSAPLVDYNFTGSTTSVQSIPGATTNSQYTINAINNKTGVIDFTGRDSGAVFRAATNTIANTPGLLFFKNGIYPGQTALQENTGGQTNWYIWSLPAPAAGNEGAWHVVCESFTQILETSLQTNGCIHQVMPSAYAGPAPSGNTLSGFWQRPSTGTFGPADFFVNNTVRIPDNQASPSNSYDTFMSIYSSHIGTVADQGILMLDQSCSGLAVPPSGVNGFRSNQSQTDETYFENTWAIGFDTPYNVLSNHPIGINMHSFCNNNAGTFTSISNTYGGFLLHFQDIHNRNGLVFNCGFPGMRFDSLNQVTEPVLSGLFTRLGGASEGTPGNCVGTITNSTYAAGNVPTYFIAGSGARFSVAEGTKLFQAGLIASSFTSAATTGTTKQTLATFTMPINVLGGQVAGIFLNNPGAVVRIKAWGIAANNVNSKVFEIDFGGTAVATITATPSVADSIKCEVEIIVSSVANTQEVVGSCDDGTARTVTRSAPGITGNANIVLNAAATTAGAAGDFTFKGWTIEYLGGN